MFDNRNNISVHDIDYVLNEFIPQFMETGATMYVLAGNHDVAFKNTNRVNSLSLLKPFKCFVVVDDSIVTLPTDGKQFVLCPWVNNENHERLMDELKFYASNDNILCGHFEFKGMSMYKNSKGCDHGLEPSSFKDFYKVYSGHFHHPSTYGNISYLGALFHFNWMDHGDWRGFHVYDSNTHELESIENIYSLFTELNFHDDDLVNMSDSDVKDSCEGQYVQIIIDKEYKRIDLKDVIHKIEKFSPISVDVVDNTILQVSPTEDEKNKIFVSETRDIRDYTDEYVGDNENKVELMELFDTIYKEAKETIVEL